MLELLNLFVCRCGLASLVRVIKTRTPGTADNNKFSDLRASSSRRENIRSFHGESKLPGTLAGRDERVFSLKCGSRLAATRSCSSHTRVPVSYVPFDPTHSNPTKPVGEGTLERSQINSRETVLIRFQEESVARHGISRLALIAGH